MAQWQRQFVENLNDGNRYEDGDQPTIDDFTAPYENTLFLKDAVDDLNNDKEPVIPSKGTAFNKNFGTGHDDVCRGDDERLMNAARDDEVVKGIKTNYGTYRPINGVVNIVGFINNVMEKSSNILDGWKEFTNTKTGTTISQGTLGE